MSFEREEFNPNWNSEQKELLSDEDEAKEVTRYKGFVSLDVTWLLVCQYTGT